jgi:hypothetical protein
MTTAEAIARKHLGAHVVSEVHTAEDVNSDGEQILRIIVLYDRSFGQLTAQAMAETTEEIWDMVQSEGKAAFPVMSFVASDEMGGLHAAE